MNKPEVWLRGPTANIPLPLAPVAHALLQAREDLEEITSVLESYQLWIKPGGAASIGFHLRHIAGSMDRLFTYAHNRALSQEQLQFLALEKNDTAESTSDDLLKLNVQTIDNCLNKLAEVNVSILDEARFVGKARLPSTVRGLLFHAGEHTTRHIGQIRTTMKVIRGLNLKE